MDPREGGGIRVVGMVRGRSCSLRYEDTLDTERERHTGPTATDSGQKLPEMADKRRSQRPGLLKMVLAIFTGGPRSSVAALSRPARDLRMRGHMGGVRGRQSPKPAPAARPCCPRGGRCGHVRCQGGHIAAGRGAWMHGACSGRVGDALGAMLAA